MIDRIVRGIERRQAPNEVYGVPGYGLGFSGVPFYGGKTDSGRHVTPDVALEAVAVYGAMSMISSAIGGLPLKVYSDADERVEATGSRQWRMLHDQPNDEMAAHEFWEIITANLLGWGNAFIYKQRQNGVVTSLWPIRASRVQVGRELDERTGTSIRYFVVSGVDGPVYETDILHIRGLSYDGQIGYSPIQLARQEIANALEMDTFRGSFWRNGMFAGGMLTHPNRLSQDAQQRLASQIAAKSGTSRAGEILVLEEGMTLANQAMPLEDAQFIEQQKMSDLRIAQLLGLVPPHQWGQGENSRSVTYQNSEFAAQEFVKWCGRRWAGKIESSVQRDRGVFPAPGPNLVCEFDFTELLRSDLAGRWAAYKTGIEGGWIDPEWVQEQEHIDIPREITPQPTKQPDQPTLTGAGTDQKALPPGRDVGTELEARALGEDGAAGLLERNAWLGGLADALGRVFKPEIRVDVAPAAQAPYRPPEIIVAPSDNRDLSAALGRFGDELATLAAALTSQEPPTVNVDVQVPAQPAPVVNVTIADKEPEPVQMQIDFTRGPNGALKGATVTES